MARIQQTRDHKAQTAGTMQWIMALCMVLQKQPPVAVWFEAGLCTLALHLTAMSPSHPPLPLPLPTLPDDDTSTSWWRCSMASLTLSAS